MPSSTSDSDLKSSEGIGLQLPLIVLFMMWICLPVMDMAFGIAPKLKSTEQRHLAPLPKLELPAQARAWHTGLRRRKQTEAQPRPYYSAA